MEDNKQEERYINGFNDGYILSRFEPDLMKKISSQPIKDNPYFDGMADGAKEQNRERFQESLQQSRAINQNLKGPRMK